MKLADSENYKIHCSELVNFAGESLIIEKTIIRIKDGIK